MSDTLVAPDPRQLGFDLQPHARRTDPETSHAAARSVRPTQRQSQDEVLYVLKQHAPCTDEVLVIRYFQHAHDGDVSPQSASGIRTRRKELERLGLVRAVGKATLKSGRQAIRWAPTSEW